MVFRYLGRTVGRIQNQMNQTERRAQYACDITMALTASLGSTWRDNGMAHNAEVSFRRIFAIDEIDTLINVYAADYFGRRLRTITSSPS